MRLLQFFVFDIEPFDCIHTRLSIFSLYGRASFASELFVSCLLYILNAYHVDWIS